MLPNVSTCVTLRPRDIRQPKTPISSPALLPIHTKYFQNKQKAETTKQTQNVACVTLRPRDIRQPKTPISSPAQSTKTIKKNSKHNNSASYKIYPMYLRA